MRMFRSVRRILSMSLMTGCIGSLFLVTPPCALAQESNFGIAAPITVTGAALYSHRRQEEDPDASSAAAAFRAVIYPSVKIGPHWFGYAAVQIHSTPFFYEEAYEPEREVETNVLQAFVGYSWSGEKKSFTVKAGQLSTAFGSFPLRYDDGSNPLLDIPLSYGYYYKPLSLYGIPGVEFNASLNRLDTRFQLTNSAPSDPQGLLSDSQHPQWAAGGGYTIRQGLRIGISAHRGPYLDREDVPPADWSRVARLPATGIGTDIQWARGRWSAAGEWQRFQFNRPDGSKAVGNYEYGEVKLILTPRLYAAARIGFRSQDFQPSRHTTELAVGFRPNRIQLLKVGYLWMGGEEVEGSEYNVFGIQYVTSIHSLSKAFR